MPAPAAAAATRAVATSGISAARFRADGADGSHARDCAGDCTGPRRHRADNGDNRDDKRNYNRDDNRDDNRDYNRAGFRVCSSVAAQAAGGA